MPERLFVNIENPAPEACVAKPVVIKVGFILIRPSFFSISRSWSREMTEQILFRGLFDRPDRPPKGGTIGAILVIRGVSIWSQGSFDRQSRRDHSQMSLINWLLAPIRYFGFTYGSTNGTLGSPRSSGIVSIKKCSIAPIARIVWDRTWAILAMAIASIAGIAYDSVSIWSPRSSHVLRTIRTIEAIIWNGLYKLDYETSGICRNTTFTHPKP